MSVEEFHKHKPKDVKPQGVGSTLDADKVDGLHASELGSGGLHAASHEIDGGDLVRPYQPISGVWRITGVSSPFDLQAEDQYLFVEGILWFDEDTGKMKVTES